MVRRVWLGAPPRDRLDEQLERYRGYAAASAQAHWTGDEVMHASDPGELAAARRAHDCATRAPTR